MSNQGKHEARAGAKVDPAMRAAVVLRYGRRARALRQTGDEHDAKIAIKLLKRIARG